MKAILEDREHQIYYSVGKAGYDTNKWPVSFNAFIRVEKELVRLGWISKVPDQEAKFGFAPRRIASENLLKQLPEGLKFTELSYKNIVKKINIFQIQNQTMINIKIFQN